MNSLQNSINYNDTVCQIIQTTRSPSWNNRVFVLLEGPDDWRIYPKFFDGSRVSLEYTGGKGQVLPSLKTLDRYNVIAIGICDADFQNLQNIAPGCSNLFFTDCHDIEMTMLKTVHILVNALTEYGLQKEANTILQDAMGKPSFVLILDGIVNITPSASSLKDLVWLLFFNWIQQARNWS